jgi:UV DNA damage endonuclease
MHPGQFFQPGSLRPEVSERGLAEVRYVARVLDLISNPDAVIVPHMGGKYEDGKATAERFVERISLETGVLRYLTLEIDGRD